MKDRIIEVTKAIFIVLIVGYILLKVPAQWIGAHIITIGFAIYFIIKVYKDRKNPERKKEEELKRATRALQTARSLK